MNANNMSDEELDKLFRDSAEHYTPPFDEEAWKAMDQKLDGAQGGWAGIHRFLPLVLLALVVTVAFVWNRTSNPPVPATAPATEVLASGLQKAERVGEEPSSQTPPTGREQAPVPDPESPAALYPAVQLGAGTGAQPTQAAENKRPFLPVTRALRFEEPLQIHPTTLPPTQWGAPGPATGIAGDEKAIAIPLAAIPAAAIPADSGQAQERGGQVFRRGVRVALVVAPDMTTVRFKDPDAVSANAGVLFSVPITRRLSVVSGAVWANKLYRATAADYKPSPDYWDGKKLPDAITAQCRVLDIPVNLQYQVLGWGRNTLSVQAGLSSYLMLKEDYTYTYTYPGREPYSKTREFSNENRHWFGIQNLSVGYTRQLSPAISVGAEPFVKIPLASIGEGRVKLTSAGVFFTAGYTLK
jgi:hypothetical protein